MAGSPPSPRSEDTEPEGSSPAPPATPPSPAALRELAHLKKLVDREESLNAKTDSEFLMAFLRFSRMKHKRAFELLKHYYDSKRKEVDLFRNLMPSELDHVFSRNLVGLLPDKDKKGRFILVLRAGAWNPDQPGYPVRKKRVDIVKQPYSFNIFFKMITPFLDAASIAKVHFHGTDTKALHERFPAKILPKEFGGTRGPFDASVCYEKLKRKEAAFAEDFEYGYV
ncbi:alpha-tocopherol transfer protein-like isoform X4 [Dermacentor albipictus]|uniref:alpha-tocopherol transfer protein-like isoform X4 n=1 Tax=Dermacentor albipictus TaxID=60249 RepID=UPI0031FDE394